MEKLPEDFKQKWLEALRSGEYTQGKQKLYNEATDSYCCIGVAGKLCGVDKMDMVNTTLFGVIRVREGYERLPPENLPAILTHRASDDVAGTLAMMNDTGKSFSEIADWIEENL